MKLIFNQCNLLYLDIIRDINIARHEGVQVGHHGLLPAGVGEEGGEHGQGLQQGLGAQPDLLQHHAELIEGEVGSVHEDVPIRGQLRVTGLQLLGLIDAGLVVSGVRSVLNVKIVCSSWKEEDNY